MNKRTFLAIITSAIVFTGCMTGSRPQFDNTAEFTEQGGTEIKGPTANLAHRLEVSFFTIRKNVRNTAHEAGSVDVVSVASETAVGKLAASTDSKRGTVQSKAVNYGVADLSTRAQADVVAAFFKGLSDSVIAYLSGGVSEVTQKAVSAIAGSDLADADKRKAILAILPADAPQPVKDELAR